MFQLQSRQQHAPIEEKTSLLGEIQGLEAKMEVLNQEIKELSKEWVDKKGIINTKLLSHLYIKCSFIILEFGKENISQAKSTSIH